MHFYLVIALIFSVDGEPHLQCSSPTCCVMPHVAGRALWGSCQSTIRFNLTAKWCFGVPPCWFSCKGWVSEFHHLSALFTAWYMSVTHSLALSLEITAQFALLGVIFDLNCMPLQSRSWLLLYSCSGWYIFGFARFQKQCLITITRVWIHYLNIAQISGCKPVCTIIMDSLVDPSSCSSGNSIHAFLYNIPHRHTMQVGHFGNCIVIAESGNDGTAFQCTQTAVRSKSKRGVTCKNDWQSVLIQIHSLPRPPPSCTALQECILLWSWTMWWNFTTSPLLHIFWASALMSSETKLFGLSKRAALQSLHWHQLGECE